MFEILEILFRNRPTLSTVWRRRYISVALYRPIKKHRKFPSLVWHKNDWKLFAHFPAAPAMQTSAMSLFRLRHQLLSKKFVVNYIRCGRETRKRWDCCWLRWWSH